MKIRASPNVLFMFVHYHCLCNIIISYSTITKASGGICNVASQSGSSMLGSEFRGLSPRPPSTSKSWESNNQGPNTISKNTLDPITPLGTCAYSSGNLQPSSSEGLSDESNQMALSSSVERSPPPFAKRYET